MGMHFYKWLGRTSALNGRLTAKSEIAEAYEAMQANAFFGARSQMQFAYAA